MRILLSLIVVAFAFSASIAHADLEPWKDYEPSEEVWSVTTVRVKPNLHDAYLEGLAQTWAAGNEVAKELGQIEDWAIYRSSLPESGDFNLLLVVKFKNSEDMQPNKEAYEAFMAKWGEERAKETTEYAQKNYPAMRKITGQYVMRKITLK